MRRIAAGVAVAVGVAVTVCACQSGGDSPGTTSSAGSSVRLPGDTTPAAAVWAVPQAFLGKWTGMVSSGAGAFDLVFTIKSGKGAEEVVDAVTTAHESGNRCESIGRMVNGVENELTFAFRVTAGTGCDDGGKLATVGLRADGAASYSSERPGGTLTGTLQKS